MTLTDSTVSGNSAFSGGGLYNDGTMTLTDSTVSGNSAFSGGGLYSDGTMTLTDSTVSGNSADSGGGLYNDGTMTLTDSTVSGNSADSGGGLYNDGTTTFTDSTVSGNWGGGLYNDGTTTLTDSTVSGNWGGGLYNDGTTTLTDSTVSGNWGGGLYNDGTTTLTDSTVSGNWGGGLFNNHGTMTLTDSTVSGNSADSGGGLYNDGTMTLTDSTVSGNSAFSGGGGLYNDGTTTLTNCTVSGNTSLGSGGGIANDGNLTLNNTIVAGNISTGTIDNDISGQVQPTSAYNLIGDGSGISSLTDLEEPALSNLIGTTADPLNPLLGPLADNGGPTQTMALLPGSPPIDAGSNALAVDAKGNPLTTDQRGPGFPRILGHSVDIGAYEFTPLSQTISFGSLAGQTYGVAPIMLSAKDTSGLPVSFSVISGPATLSGSVLTITGAGNVVVEASQAGNATYSAAAPVDESFTVSPALLTITPTAGQSMVYGGTVPALTYTYTGLVNGDTSATFSGGLATDATSSSSVGGYTIAQGDLVATGNYTIGTFNPGTLTVNAAPLTVNATGESMTYGGTVPALTYTYTGLVNGDTSATFSGGLATDATSSSSVGGYTIAQGDLVATGNYTIGTFNPGTLTVNAAPLTVNATGESMTYGGTVPALTYTYTGLVNGDTSATFSGGLATDATSSSSVGGYTIAQGDLVATGNYTIGTFNPGTLTVNAAPLTVNATGESMTYGGTVPALTYTYTGLVNGDTSATFSGGLATDATSSSSVGGYTIAQGDLVATGNYTIGTFNPGTLTVNAAPLTVNATGESMTYGGTVPALTYTYTGLVNGDTSATFSGGLATDATSSSSVGGYTIAQGDLVATGNYTIGTFNPGTLTVNAAPLTVNATGESMTYGGTVPALTYTYTGLVNGDTSATFSGGLATDATSSSSVGGYTIAQGDLVATGNYTIGTFNPGTLTVNAAPLTVNATGESMTYGGTVPALTYTYTGLVNGDTSATFSGGLATDATSSSSVGGYTIAQGDLVATGNYTIGTFNPGTLTVNAAPLTVNATGESMTYGGTVPALTYTYTGLVNGDTSATFSGGLATDATSSSSVGGYAIAQGDLVATGNYTIGTFNPGTLTVNAAPLTVNATGESMTYGGTVPALTYTYTGLVNGDTSATFSGGLATDATSSSSVGGYTIAQGDLVATGNYTIGTFNPGTLTVNAAPLTITANNDSKTYGTLKTFSSTAFTESGLVNGDTITGVTETSTGAPASATVGTYNIVPSAATGTGLGNYTIGYVNGTLTVNPATPTISWSNPAPISYFTPLTGTQLDAAASWTVGGSAVTVGGTFAYTPPAGTLLLAGTQTLSAKFTPFDSTDYTTATATIQIVVLGPGVTVIGTQLYCVGGNSTNDQVQVNPVGNSNTGSTGVKVQASLNGVNIHTTYSQSFTSINIFLQGGNENIQLANSLTINAVVTTGNGNDNVQLGNGNNIVTVGNGNDNIRAGSGSNTVMAGNGNDYVQLGDGKNTVTVGNGNDYVQLGNGSDVIVEGNGNDYVSAGNGSDLVVGGLGQHIIQLGNGNDILIDGSATVVNPGDSLRQILSDWNASSSASVNTRLKVVYNTTHPNALKAGSGRDWFFFTYSKDVTNKKSTDRLN